MNARAMTKTMGRPGLRHLFLTLLAAGTMMLAMLPVTMQPAHGGRL